jgi:glycosyltransferase involved in cell wall biosynthesis
LKPRLLILLNRLSIGGPASNTLALASALSNRYEILLVAGNPLPEEASAAYLLDQYQGFRHQLLPEIKRAVSPLQDLLTYRKIKKIIREFNPSIVHTHGSKPGILGRWAASRSKVPLIVHTYHGHVFRAYFSSFISKCIVQLERFLAQRTDLIVAINEYLQQELIQKYKIADFNKIKLNRLGVDASIYEDADGRGRKQFRTFYQLDEQTIAIAIVGRLVKIKQHTLFLEVAFRLLEQRIPDKRFCFFIVGDGDEYELLAGKVKHSAYRYLLKGEEPSGPADFIFTSWRKDIQVVMAGIDILLMTSLNEGTPVAILEALAAGKPVVSTPAGGIPELLEAAGSGYICSDKEAMTHTILELIASPEILKQQAEKGRSYILNHLSIRRQADQLVELFRAKEGA